jgi:hypothetical protein
MNQMLQLMQRISCPLGIARWARWIGGHGASLLGFVDSKSDRTWDVLLASVDMLQIRNGAHTTTSLRSRSTTSMLAKLP